MNMYAWINCVVLANYSKTKFEHDFKTIFQLKYCKNDKVFENMWVGPTRLPTKYSVYDASLAHT